MGIAGFAARYASARLRRTLERCVYAVAVVAFARLRPALAQETPPPPPSPPAEVTPAPPTPDSPVEPSRAAPHADEIPSSPAAPPPPPAPSPAGASVPAQTPAQTPAPSAAGAPSVASPEPVAPADSESPALESPIQGHGFVSQGFIKTSSNNYLADSERGSFEFTEVGLNFTKELSDKFRVGAQLFARNLGPIGNYSVQFDWFYFDYRFFDWLGIRAGRTKLPIGLYNETSDIDAARVPILLPQSVYPIQDRDFLLAQTGLELYGLVPLGGAGDLDYRAYGGTLIFDLKYEGAADTIKKIQTPYIFGGRLMYQPPVEGLQLGGSVQALRLDLDYAPPDQAVAGLRAAGQLPADYGGLVSARIPAVLTVGSIEYAPGDLLIAAEYSRWRTRIESSLPALLPDSTMWSERFYGMASYRVNSWLTPGGYYSALFPNVDERSGRKNHQHDFAATLRFDINPHWLVKLEGHFMRGTAGLSSQLNDNAPLDTLTRDWWVFLAKTTAYF